MMGHDSSGGTTIGDARNAMANAGDAEDAKTWKASIEGHISSGWGVICQGPRQGWIDSWAKHSMDSYYITRDDCNRVKREEPEKPPDYDEWK